LLQLPGCGPLSAAKLLCEIGPIDRFPTDAQLARHAASHHSTPAPANTNATASTAAATANSTARCTGSPSPKAIRCLKRQLARTVYTTLKNEPLLT
jgi:transposase